MQDSFDARMKGNVPETVKPKSSKGWMICSFILLAILIGGGVFAGMIIMKGDRDTNRLSEVEQQLKEKEDRIAELEKNEQTTEGQKTLSIDYAGLRKLTHTENGDKGTLSITKLDITKDGKYFYAIGGVSVEGTSSAGVWYKEVEESASWKSLNGGQAIGSCSALSEEAKEFMGNYKYIDDDLSSKYLACKQEDGTIFPE